MPSHLDKTISDRGFGHLPVIKGSSGYTMGILPDGTVDFGNMTPQDAGAISVYESSEAMYPALWIRVVSYNGKDNATLHLPVERAVQFAEQIMLLAAEHYQTKDDS